MLIGRLQSKVKKGGFRGGDKELGMPGGFEGLFGASGEL